MSICVFMYNCMSTYTHIKYKGTAFSVAILQLEKEACLNTVLKQLRHDRDEQCPTERTEELSGDRWSQPVSEFGWITKSSILCLAGHAHAAKPRVLCDASCCCRRSPMPPSLPGTVAFLPCCLLWLCTLPTTATPASTRPAWCSQA